MRYKNILWKKNRGEKWNKRTFFEIVTGEESNKKNRYETERIFLEKDLQEKIHSRNYYNKLSNNEYNNNNNNYHQDYNNNDHNNFNFNYYQDSNENKIIYGRCYCSLVIMVIFIIIDIIIFIVIEIVIIIVTVNLLL